MGFQSYGKQTDFVEHAILMSAIFNTRFWVFSCRIHYVDLNNEKSILKSLNKSMSDVWEEFVWITYSIPNMIVKCGILKSIPILNKDEEDIVGKLYATLSLSFDPKKLGQIMLEFKQTGENTQNLRPDFDNMILNLKQCLIRVLSTVILKINRNLLIAFKSL